MNAHIVDHGVVFQGTPGTRTANCCFASIGRFEDGTLLVSWRVGSAKDSADGTILMSRSTDGGRTWETPREPFSNPPKGRPGTFALNDVPGSLHFAPLTVLGGRRVLTGLMWLDRSNPTRPMFNERTEGLTTIHTLLSESQDGGQTWSAPRAFDAAPFDGLGAITAPILKLSDGRLACQFETNKHYDDPSPWQHRAMLKFSDDCGRTWHTPVTVAHDPTCQIRYWDQHHAIAPDGTMAAMLWAYDSVLHKELNFYLAESRDRGMTWSQPRDGGLPWQLPYPVFLPDGRLVAICIDRYKSRTIRALVSHDMGKTFCGEDMVVHQQPTGGVDPGEDNHQIADQQMWTFGRVEAVSDPSGDVWMTYYAGDADATSIHWARFRF
jgi:hypothetical protein